MHIAVTGASGFIGRHLVRRATDAGHHVTGVSREELSRCAHARHAGADVVLHLAARAHVLKESVADADLEFRISNVDLTERALDLANRIGARRFVFMSSAGVLGNSSAHGSLGDDSIARPHDAYTASKFEAEKLVQDRCGGGLSSIILRPPLVYAADAPGNFGRMLRAIGKGWPLPVGGLTAQRSMIGIRNLCDVIMRSAVAATNGCPTILVADRETISVRQLSEALARGMHRPSRIIDIPPAVIKAVLGALGRSADVPRLMHPFVLRPVLAKSLLGWEPPCSLVQELEWVTQQWRISA